MSDKYCSIGLRYNLLAQNSDNTRNVQLRYIWLDGNGYDLRTKTINTNIEPKNVAEVPLCMYCGQTCGHMKLTADSDCVLKPVILCNDPFRGDRNKLIFCVPIRYEIEASIYRHRCERVVNDLGVSNIPTFTIRQPYIILSASTRKPIGWPFDEYDRPKTTSNYGVGTNVANGRDIDEAFYRACLYAGLPISATQVEDIPAMWSFEIGPTRGLTIADELWMARYILHYIAEEFNCVISFDPLKQIVSNNLQMKVWTEEQSSRVISFAMNIDPYIAVQNICQINKDSLK